MMIILHQFRRSGFLCGGTNCLEQSSWKHQTNSNAWLVQMTVQNIFVWYIIRTGVLKRPWGVINTVWCYISYPLHHHHNCIRAKEYNEEKCGFFCCCYVPCREAERQVWSARSWCPGPGNAWRSPSAVDSRECWDRSSAAWRGRCTRGTGAT